MIRFHFFFAQAPYSSLCDWERSPQMNKTPQYLEVGPIATSECPKGKRI